MDRRTEAAWAAGFFDGEGCTTFFSTVRPDERAGRRNHIKVNITQNDREVLDRFLAVVGVGAIYAAPKYNRFQYQAQGYERARTVIRVIWPYLGRLKREQWANAERRWLTEKLPPLRPSRAGQPAGPNNPLYTHGRTSILAPEEERKAYDREAMRAHRARKREALGDAEYKAEMRRAYQKNPERGALYTRTYRAKQKALAAAANRTQMPQGKGE